jgi:hypothetical protein
MSSVEGLDLNPVDNLAFVEVHGADLVTASLDLLTGVRQVEVLRVIVSALFVSLLVLNDDSGVVFKHVWHQSFGRGGCDHWSTVSVDFREIGECSYGQVRKYSRMFGESEFLEGVRHTYKSISVLFKLQ